MGENKQTIPSNTSKWSNDEGTKTMTDTEIKQKALIAVSDAFADNHLTYEDAINVMACYVKHIGKKCGSDEYAAVLMISALDRLMPELKHRV